MKKPLSLVLILFVFSALNMGMAGRGVYDEEAREAERQEKAMRKYEKEYKKNHPVKGMATGIKEVAYDSPTEFVSETADGAADGPISGTLEGARQASGNLADTAIKGAFKAATFGYADVKEVKVEEPESNTDQTTKWSIAIPGT